MDVKKIIDWDRRAFDKMVRFQLPNNGKRIGIGLALFSVALLFVLKWVDDEPLWVRDLLRNLLIIGLLMISISREKIEDEMIKSIRSQSYAISFIMGVFYAVIQPYITYGVELLIDPENALLEMSYFQVIAFMLLIQIMFFRVLLRKCMA